VAEQQIIGEVEHDSAAYWAAFLRFPVLNFNRRVSIPRITHDDFGSPND
jgi:hypothetical protein